MFRLFGLFSLAMLGLGQAQNTTDHFYVQVVFNDGNALTTHQSCSEADFFLIQDAIADVPARRRLGSMHRKLPNCPALCCDYAWLQCAVYGCTGGRYPTPTSNQQGGCNADDDFVRRNLGEIDGDLPDSGLLFVDPDDPMWYGGDRRSLQQMLTIEDCNAKRAEIYQHLLTTLPDVSTRCNNFVLGPIRMQCVLVLG